MKKILPLIAMALLSVSTFATIHTVTVSDFQFSPTTIPSVKVGDTVKWVWVNGSHTTTSSSVPAGAATWDQPITSSATSFSYKVTVAGAYTYVCTPHAPGMAASFTVQNATGVPTAATANPISIMPNPAGNFLRVEAGNSTVPVDITIVDGLGRIVQSTSYQGKNSIDIVTEAFASGFYIIRVKSGGNDYSQLFEIRH